MFTCHILCYKSNIEHIIRKKNSYISILIAKVILRIKANRKTNPCQKR